MKRTDRSIDLTPEAGRVSEGAGSGHSDGLQRQILDKLESIERRLEALETSTDPASALLSSRAARNAAAAAADTFDEAMGHLAQRGIDVDARVEAGLRLLEKLSAPGTTAALEAIVERVETLEPLIGMVSQAPAAVAASVDALDEEVARLGAAGLDIEAAVRNGLTALLYIGQRVSTQELEAFDKLLRSDVLHPHAMDMVGRLGCALVSAAESPPDSVGPFKALRRLGDPDARRSTGFLLEFARRFGAALNGSAPASSGPLPERRDR